MRIDMEIEGKERVGGERRRVGRAVSNEMQYPGGIILPTTPAISPAQDLSAHQAPGSLQLDTKIFNITYGQY